MKRLIITTTHGDEDFAVPVVQKIRLKFNFDWITGNPKATEKKVRFVETDLNRCGPGSIKAASYEERRAYQVIKKASTYDQVIDIHGTVSNSGVFIILSDPNWQNIALARTINLEKIVLWPSLQNKGPLTQFIPNSLEIECGPKNDKKTAAQLEKVLTDYLSNKPVRVRQEFFIVTGQLKTAFDLPMKNFEKETVAGKNFYPLLVDQYPGIKCYTLQKLENTLSYTQTS